MAPHVASPPLSYTFDSTCPLSARAAVRADTRPGLAEASTIRFACARAAVPWAEGSCPMTAVAPVVRSIDSSWPSCDVAATSPRVSSTARASGAASGDDQRRSHRPSGITRKIAPELVADEALPDEVADVPDALATVTDTTSTETAAPGVATAVEGVMSAGAAACAVLPEPFIAATNTCPERSTTGCRSSG